MALLWQSTANKLKSYITQCFNFAVWSLGPLFILIAMSLVSLAAYSFFEGVLQHYFPLKGIGYYSNVVIGVYLLVMITFQYTLAIFTSAGGVNGKVLAALQSLENRRQRLNEQHKLENSSESILKQESDALLNQNQVLNALDPSTSAKPLKTARFCRKCNAPKPDRTHHCSVCKKCVLRMDHHCPWIHNCVGHFNHRYFYLFMVYLVVACFYYSIMAAPIVYDEFFSQKYMNTISGTQRALILFILMVTVAIGLAVGGMTIWHTYLIATAQTTIEYHSNQATKHYKAAHGETFFNEYDMGTARNFRIFFNIGQRYSWFSIFLPLRVPPLGDGVHWLTCDDVLSTRGGTWRGVADFTDHAHSLV